MPLSRCSCLEIALANLRKRTLDPKATINLVAVTDGNESALYPALTVKYRPRRKFVMKGKPTGPVIDLPVTALIPPTYCPFCGKKIKIKEPL